jgi:hypothetical protein
MVNDCTSIPHAAAMRGMPISEVETKMDDNSPSAGGDDKAPLPVDHDDAAAPSTSGDDGNGLPDRAALVAEIGRLARLVGFLRTENERLAAERHDFRLRLEMQQNQAPRPASQNATKPGVPKASHPTPLNPATPSEAPSKRRR